jgi:cytochrome c oxidase assembly factor CtaG
VPAPLLFALIVVLAILVAIPVRRLYLAGWRGWPLLTYFVFVLGLALLVAELRGPARFLVPILVVAYLAPFVTARDGVARLLGRGPEHPSRPMKDVTPPDDREPPG